MVPHHAEGKRSRYHELRKRLQNAHTGHTAHAQRGRRHVAKNWSSNVPRVGSARRL